MLHLPIDTYFLREKIFIIAILSYPIKYLHVDLQDFSRNRTAVLGDFFFNCSAIRSQVGLTEQSRLNITISNGLFNAEALPLLCSICSV